MSQIKYDFFISYNKNDKKHASRVAKLIKSSGLERWWQEEYSQQEYAQKIKEGIDASKAFVVLLSASSAESEWVGKEILYALRRHSIVGLKILPIVVEELSENDYDFFHHILGDFNWLFVKDYGSDRELIRAISKQVDIKLSKELSDSIYSAEAEIEQERLRKQNNIYSIYAIPCIDEVFEKIKSPSVLDVGSSDAESIMLRLKGKSFSHLLCIDKEKGKLELASGRYGDDPRISFLAVDITSKGLRDTLKKYLDENGLEGFDLIHISAVLLHLKNALPTLRVLRELLSENGTILVQDEDDGLNATYEEDTTDPTFFSDCFYIWEHSKESGDRHMGRKLPVLLRHAGFSSVEMRCSIISSVDFKGSLKEDLWDIYFNPKYWVVDSPDYFDKADAFEKCIEYKNRHGRKKQKYMKDKIFVSLGVPIFTAKK